jgi:capsid protein
MSRVKLAWQYAKAAGRIMAGGYDAAKSDRNRGDMPWGSAVSQDEDHFVTGYDRETIRQKLLHMRRNVPLVKSLCDRMCDFVVGPAGLQVQALTDDPAWNNAAEQWFAAWCRNCDVTGRIPFRRIQRGLVDARLWAGESFILFTDDGHLQAIEAERVRQPVGVPETATQG